MNAKKQQLICKIEGRAKIKLYSLLRYYRLTVFQLRNGLQIKTFYWLVQQIVFFFLTVDLVLVYKYSVLTIPRYL